MGMPPGTEDIIARLIADQFGEGRGSLRSISTMRADATDDYHQVQLREKPNDASVHSNYGAFLADTGRADEAEAQYRVALAIRPDHTNALGNLANLVSARGELDEARRLYEAALSANPAQENVSWNFARLLFRTGSNQEALAIAEAGSSKNVNSGRLHLLVGELRLVNGDTAGALSKVQEAREHGGIQAQVEALNAYATQLSGAPVGVCIAAYEVALAVSPQDPNLRLNLAQLLFVQGDNDRAKRELPPQESLGDDGRLERLFYELAHTSRDQRAIASTMNAILTRGGRTTWDFSLNIETIERRDTERASLLRRIANALATGSAEVLDQIS
jgi:Flp pilus assembly protein TadD